MKLLLLPKQLRRFQQLTPAAICLRFALAVLGIALVPMGTISHAQQNLAALKPPPGSHVALFEFADLQCPMCARENSLLKDAAAKYHVPWLRHDFPLPMHNWSFQAAVNARWFDAQPKHPGNDYRDAVFANQAGIETISDLNQFTSNFARQHGIPLPFAIDPVGTLSNAVKADAALAQSMGVHQTPTVWIVTDKTGGAQPYVEVKDFSKLYVMLDEAIAKTSSHARK
jgi:protein-disulfide isomerase